MAFSRVKPAGWAFGELLTSLQMNSLDIDHANAVDGLNGGAYVLSGPLSLSGAAINLSATTLASATVTAGLAVGGSVAISGSCTTIATNKTLGLLWSSGDARVDGNTIIGSNFSDSLTVNATPTFYGVATFNGAATFNANVSIVSASLSVGGNGTFSGTLSTLGGLTTSSLAVGGSTTLTGSLAGSSASFTGNVTLGDAGTDALTVNANSQFNGTTIFGGATNRFDGLLTWGSGRMLMRTGEASSSGSFVYNTTSVNIIYVQSTSISADISQSLADSVQDGDWFMIGTTNSTHVISLYFNGTEVEGIGAASGGGNVKFLMLVWKAGGGWKRVAKILA